MITSVIMFLFRMCFKMIFVIILMLVLTYHSTQAFVSQRVVIIDQRGFNSLKCCTGDQGCHCSNLSLALENIKNDTEIKLLSDISLQHVTKFMNISNVTITGNDHTVQCNHQGGLVGENIINIVIQGVTWDKCNGIKIVNFSNTGVINCTFQYSVTSPALTLVGQDMILLVNSTFSYNGEAVHVFAPSIIVSSCTFYGNGLDKYHHYGTLSINSSFAYISTAVTVTVTETVFGGNFGAGIICDGFFHSLIQLNVSSATFVNNAHSAVELLRCHMFLLGSVTFKYNSVDRDFEVSSGGAIHSSDSLLDVFGSVTFLKNTATNGGGAICLQYSNMTIHRGIVLFYQNTAFNGGALSLLDGSALHVNQAAGFEFVNNSASYYGGGVYVDMTSWYDDYESATLYYYNLLTTSNRFQNNKANRSGNYAYFDNFVSCTPCIRCVQHKELFSSTPCSVTIFDASVNANVSNSSSYGVTFLASDLQFNAIVLDYFNNLVGPFDITFTCSMGYGFCGDLNYDLHCDAIFDFTSLKYTIDSIRSNVTLISFDSYLSCCLTNPETFTLCVSSNIAVSDVSVQWQRQSNECNDIMHYSNCELVSCQHKSSLPPGCKCHGSVLTISQGYWYDNGLYNFVKFCPIIYCEYFNWNDILFEAFPDRDLQCRSNRCGYSCGECKHTYSISYGTTDCIPSKDCLMSSVMLSYLVLFVVSFFYWCLVITFIFVMLHFKFQVGAGYAFGIIFFYSILEQVFSVFNQVYQILPCSINRNNNVNSCSLPYYISNVLPFFSSIGTLQPPFIQYLKLCLGETEMIDHKFLVYIHPLIVFSIVVTIFVSARRFVFVARYFGRFVNSRSISLLVLLSYSSVSYTSVQMLRPLASYHDVTKISFAGWRSYWSPHIKYFHSRHAGYATIAILCEVVIGFGFPFLLLFQRYLTRHHDINFMSIRPIIDQLQACYKNECYWFSTYYLICRQIIYGVDVLCDISFGFWLAQQQFTIVKLIILLMFCVLIVMIHLWFQPYRIKSLNILDGTILLTLVCMLISSLDLSSQMVAVAFWALPLVLFINYLCYSTKLRHMMIFITTSALFTWVCIAGFDLHNEFLWPYASGGVVALLFTFALACFIGLHISYMMIKFVILMTRCVIRKIRRPRNAESHLLAQDIQNNSDEEDNSD